MANDNVVSNNPIVDNIRSMVSNSEKTANNIQKEGMLSDSTERQLIGPPEGHANMMNRLDAMYGADNAYDGVVVGGGSSDASKSVESSAFADQSILAGSEKFRSPQKSPFEGLSSQNTGQQGVNINISPDGTITITPDAGEKSVLDKLKMIQKSAEGKHDFGIDEMTKMGGFESDTHDKNVFDRLNVPQRGGFESDLNPLLMSATDKKAMNAALGVGSVAQQLSAEYGQKGAGSLQTDGFNTGKVASAEAAKDTGLSR